MGSKEKEEFVITVANQIGTKSLTRATAQLNGTQFKMIHDMVPFYGSDEAEVVKKHHDLILAPKRRQHRRRSGYHR